MSKNLDPLAQVKWETVFESLFAELMTRVESIVRRVWLDDGLAHGFTLLDFKDGHVLITLTLTDEETSQELVKRAVEWGADPMEAFTSAKIPYHLLLDPSSEGISALQDAWIEEEVRAQEAAQEAARRHANQLLEACERAELQRLKEKYDENL